jgi:hypothetical protein
MIGELRGQVFYWDSQGTSDDSEGETATQYPLTYYIADSFTDLLNRIQPYCG